MNTDDLSIEAKNASYAKDGWLYVRCAKTPHLADEMIRKGFERVSIHTWRRPVGYKLDPNAYTEN
jgi:hypothetical protein